jgi:hypothetical protein
MNSENRIAARVENTGMELKSGSTLITALQASSAEFESRETDSFITFVIQEVVKRPGIRNLEFFSEYWKGDLTKKKFENYKNICVKIQQCKTKYSPDYGLAGPVYE